MSQKFTSYIREFLASSFVSSVENARVTDWVTGTVESTIGTKRLNAGNIYVNTTTGTSGAVSPTHVAGAVSDGGVTWLYIEKANTSKLFEGNMYLGIGRAADWADSNNPDTVQTIDSVESDVLDKMITLKSITSDNIRACAVRHDWTTGTIYDAYDSLKDFGDYTNPFYVLTDTNDVYKCLDNFNGAQSTSKPTTQSTAPFRTADGYVWKYMGSVDSSESTLFMTQDYIPLNVKKSASDGAAQYAVQQSAQIKSISSFKIHGSVGSFTNSPVTTLNGDGTLAVATAHKTGTTLDQVYITNPGTGYTFDNTYAYITNDAPQGSGAVASAVINPTTGAITSISVTTGGSGYTNGAVAFVVGVPKTGQTLTQPTSITVSISSGTITSLVPVGATANYASAKVYIVPCGVGALALPVMAPVNGHGANIVKELNASSVMINVRLTNTINDTGYHLIGVGSDFHQISLVTDVVDFTTNKYATKQLYIGKSHPDYATTTTLSKVKAGSGIVLYINNVKTVTRSSSQEEDIKIALSI